MSNKHENNSLSTMTVPPEDMLDHVLGGAGGSRPTFYEFTSPTATRFAGPTRETLATN